jgi:dTDP-4-dehydrorhamnose reductase
MRIFITGANGQLAQSILPLLHNDELCLATRKQLDITDAEAVEKQISQFKPDIVFHFASMTRGDECAKNPDEAQRINVEGTKNIVKACKKVGAAILFVSTNEVFDGTKTTPYNEDDIPNPITIVGKTKLDAESYIRQHLNKHFIVRTSWLYSSWSANFLHAVIKKAVNDNEIELVEDEVGSPTYSNDLAYAIYQLIQTAKYGTYHISNVGKVSRLKFAKKVFQHYSLDQVVIIPIPLDKYRRLSKPPLFSPLESNKLHVIGVKMAAWDNALKRFLSQNDLLAQNNLISRKKR